VAHFEANIIITPLNNIIVKETEEIPKLGSFQCSLLKIEGF
jgi:hypothetical protein